MAVPGLDRKIVEWANSQHYARIEREKLTTEGSERRMDRAQRNSMIIATLGLILATVQGIWGNAWLGGIIAAVAVGGPTAATILSRGMSRGLPDDNEGDGGDDRSRSKGTSTAQPTKPAKQSPAGQRGNPPAASRENS
ncbi:hypothetical protein [Azospirillum sp. B510]|uniref:hypothetical protein n=1 Tax=Azospirillum sp. (strain B510) TaxID=137722 RepID=UPI0013053108|nr:hypothetical protein [Azospirillum sp. B510]